MTVEGAGQTIAATVATWEAVSRHPHRFGGTEFHIGQREFGHLHGDSLVDIPFPTRVRHALVAAGRAQPHHVLPDSGWVSFYIEEPGDVEQALALLRESHALALAQFRRRSQPAPPDPPGD